MVKKKKKCCERITSELDINFTATFSLKKKKIPKTWFASKSFIKFT